MTEGGLPLPRPLYQDLEPKGQPSSKMRRGGRSLALEGLGMMLLLNLRVLEE